MTDPSKLPDFDSLPQVHGMPHGCAWGIFDQGKKDQFGCVNFLTPAIVRESFKEARDGVSISLNWPIGALPKPGFSRKGLEHKVLSFKESPLDLHGFDDEVEFNTQCSSQWDGLAHYAHQPTGRYYNGADASIQKLKKGTCDLPTLDHWHDRGGLVGRGVLLDYRAYTQAKGFKYDCFDSHAITVQDLEAVAAHQNTELKPGDILVVRTGYTEELEAANAQEQERILGTNKAVGVKGCKETAKWFWNHRFSAVAGDAISFEVIPPTIEEEGNRPGTMAELVLHQYFLSLFGLCIGELWDLKNLSDYCKKVKRYEFLLTSVPLNVPGAVGSPANALAIF